MKERPILFSGPMVRAILDGRKTQTRRVIKSQPPASADLCICASKGCGGNQKWHLPCPYGRPGDRLWVREAWAASVALDDRKPTDAEKPGKGYGWPVWYAADGGAVTWRGATEGGPMFTTRGKGRHSIHMPRWASRIMLEVVGVRVERLNEISEKDAVAEGCDYEAMSPDPECSGSALWGPSGFAALWESINGRGSWAENPWVWVVEFKRVERRAA